MMCFRTLISLIALTSASISAGAGEKLEVAMLGGEKWYGAASGLGRHMPIKAGSRTIDLRTMNFNNQTTPLLVSSKGRLIWNDGPITISMDPTTIEVEAFRGKPVLLSADNDATLRGAYNLAVEKFMPPEGGIPPEEFFSKPIFNTWIELMYDQNQADIMKYARAIIDNGYAPGVLMIDDNWQKDYGDFEFRPDRFPDPKGMVDSLHSMGFKVMLWVSPFISPDYKEARDIHNLGYLVKSADGSNMGILNWWNGFSGAYDLSNPAAYNYLKEKLQGLQREFGVDGFKFDGGDPERYLQENISVSDGRSFDTEQTRLWAQLAEEFPYNELRACWQMGNRPLVQRLGDKPYSWEGVAQLVPAMINAALIGHPYACPDMIGGGDYGTFLNVDEKSLDADLIVRSCQIHSMMPMMQFSVAPWRILSPEYQEICRKYAELHVEMGPYIIEQARKTALTGVPIVRHMAYEFPDEGFDDVMDQYMLGDRYLVAPITSRNNTRTVKLPKGKWRDDTGKTHKGGRTIILADVAIDRLPRFERIK